MLVRLFVVLTIISAGVQAQSAKQFRTPWGEPDLQGIWNGETLTPLQRPARFANQPVLMPEEAAKAEAEVDSRAGRDKRAGRGTEKDVAGAASNLACCCSKLAPAGRVASFLSVKCMRSCRPFCWG